MFGIGFRVKRGLLQPFFLHGILESHTGHKGNGAILGYTSLFEVKQKPFLARLTAVSPHLVGFSRDIGQKFVEVITSSILNKFV